YQVFVFVPRDSDQTLLILSLAVGLPVLFGALWFFWRRKRVTPASPTIKQPQPSPNDAGQNVLAKLINEAKGGNPEAQLQLAGIYDNGRGVPQDHVQAFKWCQQAADQGLPQAQYWLAKKYLNGEGIGVDKKKGCELLRKAAKQGLQQAKDDLLRLC